MRECPECGRCLADTHVVCPDDGAHLELAFEGSTTLDGKYLLLRSVGGGGMAQVYRARHLGLQRVVAVKVLRPAQRRRDAFLIRFRREASILARLSHPRLVEVTDFGVDETRGIPYLVMELLEGRSLAEHVEEMGALPLETAVPILGQVAEAMAQVHQGGAVHGDLKPSNVFLGFEDDRPVVKLLDFGLARMLVDPDRTPVTGEHGNDTRPDLSTSPDLESRLWGTPGYIAPERYAGAPPSPGSDIFALGALAVQVLTGRVPARPPASPLPDDGDLPPRIHAALAPLLANDPDERPRSAVEGVDRLREAAEAVRRRRWLRQEGPRRTAFAAGLGIVLTALALTLGPGPLRGLDAWMVDLQFRLSPSRPADSPLLLVLFDDAALKADPAPLATKGNEVGMLLGRILAEGGVGVGLDLLLPRQWGRSPGFSELLVRHPDRVVLAAYSPSGGAVVGSEAVDGLTAAALGPERAEGLFGYVNIIEDPDGVVRRGRARWRDLRGSERSSFAAKIAESLGAAPGSEESFWIDFTLDGRSFESLSWRDLEGALSRHPEALRDRFVLVGADYSASGDRHFRVPSTRDTPALVAGTVLHALAVQTLLEGRPVRSAGGFWSALLLGLLVFCCAAACLLASRPFTGIALTMSAVAAWLVYSLVAFAWRGVLLPVAGPLLALIAVAFLGWGLRRWLGALPRLA